MKLNKTFLRHLWTLMIGLCLSVNAQAQTPYAVLSNDNTVLTFYYDDQKESRGGMSVGPFIPSSDRGWDAQCKTITTVAFDASFANYTYLNSTYYWFCGCENLTTITGIENLNTKNVTSMDAMFSGCSSLTSLDVSSFKTDKVMFMSHMFSDCSSLTSIDLSGFKTDNVTRMSSMFYGCSSLTSLDVSSFKTDRVTDMSYMFGGCSNLTSLDLSSFKTDRVTDMSNMFSECRNLTSLDLSGFKTDNVKGMEEMFAGCVSLTSLDLSGFKTDKVTNMSYMFAGCACLTSLDVSSFKTENVTNMENMFSYCRSLTILDLSGFKTDRVTGMSSMFEDCSNLTSLDLSGFKTANVKSMSSMFEDCSNLTSLDLSSFMTENVTYMCDMFRNCSNLTSLDLSSFKTDNVTDMCDMFEDCSNLTSLDLSSFKTENVTHMEAMFCNCFNLTSLDLSSFKTDNVTDMWWMFKNCNSLSTIYVGEGWTTIGVTDGTAMFTNCNQLIGGFGTVYDSNHVDHTYAHLDEGESNPGYLSNIIIKIQNATREYGEANPVFNYTANIADLGGTPNISCEAMTTSPVGEYPIIVTKGSVNKTGVTYVNGTLTITKAPLMVSVKDCIKDEGEVNPTFELSYSGFKNGETEEVLIKKPIATCVATDVSSPGRYTIAISGGEATNYELIYTDGTLTVKEILPFVLDNITYKVIDIKNRRVSAVSALDQEQVEIPASVTYSNHDYSVTALEDRAFYGLQQLKSVEIPASVTTFGNDLFGNCPNLSAIVWQPLMAIPASLLTDISNPNLLLYANASRWTDQVPSVISNKIHDGLAKSITLTDGYPFYCPQEFIAEQISYTHEYKQETIIGKCQGWETIALPFTVQTITHEDETKGEIAPFAANNASARPFWLYSMQPSGEKFVPASVIRSNTPYILSMPNNQEYVSRYNLAGKVTFSAKDATVEASTALHTIQRNATGYSVTFIPSYSCLAQTDDIMALNRDGVWQDSPQGSIFRSHRTVQPFEAYILWQGGAGVKEFRIADDDATDIRELFNQQSPIINPLIYDLSGRRIVDGNKQVHSLRPGVYIHQGRKILVK